MDFRVKERREIDREEWERLVQSGSFFHTLTWIDVCLKGARRKAEAVFLCGYRDRRLAAAMPTVVFSRFGQKSLHSMPDGTYGGPVFAEDCSDRERAEFLNRIIEYLENNKFSAIYIVDFGRTLSSWENSKLEKTEHFTHIIELPENGKYKPQNNIKFHIRAGRKRNSEIVRIDTPEKVEDFYRLLLLTEKKHENSGPRRELNFFLGLLEIMGDSDKLYWTGLRAEEKLVGGQIHFIHGNTLFNWQNVFDYRYRQYKPGQILTDDAIGKAVKLGIRFVNLGASPPDAEGLIKYKESWRGKRVDYDIYSSRSKLRKLLGR